MISLILPTRSRPEKSYQTLMKWVENWYGQLNIELIVSVDEDDEFLMEYWQLYKNDRFIFVQAYNKSSIEAINLAAAKATGDILMVISDDFMPCPKWDLEIFNAATDGVYLKKDWIMKTDDGIQKRIITLPIMHKDYYKRDGFIYNPAYLHSFADTEMTEVAHKRGCVIDARNIKFPHRHYSVTGEQPDELYKRNDATHDSGRKIFQERQRINFGL